MRLAILSMGVLGGMACHTTATSQPQRAVAEKAPLVDTSVSTVDTAKIDREITAMMQRSAQSWNRGDLDAFVSDYAAGQRTTFVTGRGVLHGRDAIKAAYAPRFTAGARHDSLSFEHIQVDVLAPHVANVIAYYRLMRGDSTTAYGPTSLVMQQQRNGRWQIIHDHSS